MLTVVVCIYSIYGDKANTWGFWSSGYGFTSLGNQMPVFSGNVASSSLRVEMSWKI